MAQPRLFESRLPEYRVVFDGGSLGNPGVGYGSYRITGPGVDSGIVQLEFSQNGEIVSNNQAEYRSLIAALDHLPRLAGRPARECAVVINGDSKLVIEQLSGRWKVKHPDMKVWHAEAKELLSGFGEYRLTWHARKNSVKELGH
ncbi:MAG: ribonuclease HI family protein [Chloroflexota bacterium]|nr:ribonuclease HI family protein [Chloroflexota bacterium]